MKKRFEQAGGQNDSLKGPSFKVVGKISEKARESLKDAVQGAFHDRHYENMPPEIFAELKENEMEKTPEQIELILLSDKETSETMKRVGAEPYSIPLRNIHLVPDESYNKIRLSDNPKQSSARAVSEFQAVFVNADKVKGKDIFFASLVFHEIMHLKGKISFEVIEDEDKVYIGAYKTGFTVFSPRAMDKKNKEHSHMDGLEEALVSAEEKKYIRKILELPRFASEKKRMESEETKKIKASMAAIRGIKEEDIFWVSDDGKFYLQVSYPKQREVLGFVMEEIMKENPEKYENLDEVQDEFLKAFFGGSFYSISRLVENTFGKGSFRVLGLMTGEDNSAIGVMETLKSMRRAKKSFKK